MERILGLDVGTKRIGVAISDPLGLISRELELVLRDNKAISRIKELAHEYGAGKIVVGVPYNDDDTIGPQAQDCIDFAAPLASEFEIVYHDERLSSQTAEMLLRREKKKYTKNKGLVDLKSACLILQEYLQTRI
jgi:putative Holliday junction resolvase